MGSLFRSLEQENPAQGRVFVESFEMRATAYPAGNDDSGRRAREVMPAAMRAVAVVAAKGADAAFMAQSEHEWAGLAIRRLPDCAAGGLRHSAGVTLTRTRRRSPGS